VRQDSLPDDVVQQVIQLWDEGQKRDAFALLYRATMTRLIHQHGFEFYAGFTEQECVDVVEQGGDAHLTAYLQQLTPVWQRLAYAHQIPQQEKFFSLCTEWQVIFEGAQDAA